MANNVNVILDAASVQVIDTVTNTYRVNSAIGAITLTANVANYQSFAVIASSPGTVLTLPATKIWFLYVKNLDATANLTVQFQAFGGSLNTAANSEILTPGGVKIYANSSEGAGGIIAVTLISSSGPTAAEVLLAA
jgi:hypothetical protein